MRRFCARTGGIGGRRLLWGVVVLVLLGTWLMAASPGLAAEGVEAAAATGADASRPSGDEGFMTWALGALGPFYSVVFFALAVSTVALFVLNLLGTRRENVVPGELVRRVQDDLGKRQFQHAYDAAQGDASMLARVLSAGLAGLSGGYDRALEAMESTGQEETMKLEHRLSYLALVATIAPMIGLFGTVHGMIASFRVIAGAEVAPRPWQLAQGISTALFTTLMGLAVAIPALLTYNLLRNRVARLVLEVGIITEGLLGKITVPGKSTGRVP